MKKILIVLALLLIPAVGLAHTYKEANATVLNESGGGKKIVSKKLITGFGIPNFY